MNAFGGPHGGKLEGFASLNAQKEGHLMLLALFVIFLVLWLLGFVAFHVASGLIHILLIVAIIALILHFVRRSRAV